VLLFTMHPRKLEGSGRPDKFAWDSKSRRGRASYMRVRRLWNFAGRYLHALALAAHTFTLGLASPKRRYLIAQLARSAGYRGYPRTELPAASIADFTNEFTPVALGFPDEGDGGVSVLELVVLARLTRERQPTTVFEIGTFRGRSTAVLAANSPDEAVVYTLDLPADHPTRFAVVDKERTFIDKHASGQLVHGSPYAAKVRQLFGDSATFDFADYEADLVFVDGSHSYEYVISDSRGALSMLRRGKGTVVWHDYGEWEGVTRALNDLARTDDRFAGLRHVRDTTLAILTVH
jgi:predicted O-methyltransferase YrrM